MPQVEEQAFEQRIEPQRPLLTPLTLCAPDMARENPHRSPLDRFRTFNITAENANQLALHFPTSDIRQPHPHPFPNDSTFEFIKQCCLGRSSQTLWGSTKIAMLFASGKVIPEELNDFSARAELRRLDKFADDSRIAGGPWKEKSVKIRMPCTQSNNPGFSNEKDAPTFEVPGIRVQSLVNLLSSHIQDPATSASCVYTPFSRWWLPLGGITPIRVYGEAYNSDIAIQLYEEIRQIPPPVDSPEVESVVALLLLGSDATHLADFGMASLWPIYVAFGNMSKYDRSRPSEFPVANLAYLPDVI